MPYTEVAKKKARADSCREANVLVRIAVNLSVVGGGKDDANPNVLANIPRSNARVTCNTMAKLCSGVGALIHVPLLTFHRYALVLMSDQHMYWHVAGRI